MAQPICFTSLSSFPISTKQATASFSSVKSAALGRRNQLKKPHFSLRPVQFSVTGIRDRQVFKGRNNIIFADSSVPNAEIEIIPTSAEEDKIDAWIEAQIAALPDVYNDSQKEVRRKALRQQLRSSKGSASESANSILKARAKGKGILLEWTTAGEQDNAGFILEKKDPSNETFAFVASYKTSKELLGQGTSDKKKTYRYVDSLVEDKQTYLYKLLGADSKQGTSETIAATSVTVRFDEEEEDESLPVKLEFGMTPSNELLHSRIAMMAMTIGFIGEVITGKGFIGQLSELLYNLTRP